MVFIFCVHGLCLIKCLCNTNTFRDRGKRIDQTKSGNTGRLTRIVGPTWWRSKGLHEMSEKRLM